MMFYFIIPRTPVKLRNPLREELWEIAKTSLLAQTSKNWKALIIGDTTYEKLNPFYFITLHFDAYTKQEKIKLALDYIEKNTNERPRYLIRFDDDDVFSENILHQIEQLAQKYDCYYDEYHTYIDPVYMKLSQKKNSWIANTAVHKYEHAIKSCGRHNLPLLMQDHSEYWHIYYQDKQVYKTSKQQPLYYRVLTPFSITGGGSSASSRIDWTRYLSYLKGYGPWIALPLSFAAFKELKRMSVKYFAAAPSLSRSYWIFNRLKYYRNHFFRA